MKALVGITMNFIGKSGNANMEKREKREILERALLPFTLRAVETAVNMYVWLVYNNLTLEDVREDLDYIRHAKMRDKINMVTLDSTTSYEDLPYSFMKILQRTFRDIKNGKRTPEELIGIYHKERKRVLSHVKYGRKRCRKCEREKWPWEVLR